MIKCGNCLVKVDEYNNGFKQSFDFYADVAEHKGVFFQDEMNKYLDWEKKKAEETKELEEQKKRGYGYSYNQYSNKENPHRIKTIKYCDDCARSVKKIEINRRNQMKLEPELEVVKKNILDLQNNLISIIKQKDEDNKKLLEKLIELTEKNNQLLIENTKVKQELLVKEVTEKTRTYCIIEQPLKK